MLELRHRGRHELARSIATSLLCPGGAECYPGILIFSATEKSRRVCGFQTLRFLFCERTVIIGNVSRLRRLVLSDRYFFITCRLFHSRSHLSQYEFECLTKVIEARRQAHGFLVTAWVFLPDHWHAIFYPRHPLTISGVMESIKVSSTRQVNRMREESGTLWQGRFFDRAIRTAKEYHQTLEYIHWNPVTAGLVSRPEDWPWSSVHDYFGSVERSMTSTITLRADKITMPLDPSARI